MDTLEIARAGAACLANLVQKDGSFRYRYDSRTGELIGGYNVLRHAGALWAMFDVYRDVSEKKILQCGQAATLHLLDSYLRFFRGYTNTCICEENTVKLGGNALAVLALVALFEITKESFLVTLAEQLARFMLEQRTATGQLIHKRYFLSGKISSFQSMYYTGEALLAFLVLFRVTQERRWYEAVWEIEEGLAAEAYGVKEQSHWMLYALELLSRYNTSLLCYGHAEKIAVHILENPEYLLWERSTPIACRTEGLLAFLRLKRPDSVDDTALQARCLEQIRENLRRQLAFRLPDGAFVRGGHDQRRDEVRIDYIQHNISSFLYFSRQGLRWQS